MSTSFVGSTTVLQLISALSTLLHCHCLFNLAGQSAFYHIQTTFAGLSYCSLLMFSSLPVIINECDLNRLIYYIIPDKIYLLYCYYKQFPFAPAFT
jgi:hypothetical protein